MVYDFIAKIRNVKNIASSDPSELSEAVSEISKKVETKLELNFIIPPDPTGKDIIIKTKASVSSFPVHHDRDLDNVVRSFRTHLEMLAEYLQGEVSQNDAFYNNSTTFKRVF